MKDFFVEQLDYITFVYGLALVLLAVAGFILTRHREQRLPWLWMSLFGLVHGLGEWVSLLALVFEGALPIRTVSTVLTVASFVLLLEFGRSGSGVLSGRRTGWWVYGLLAFPAAGLYGGLAGAELASRYTLCLIGGLWSARVLLHASRGTSGTPRGVLAVAAGALATFILAEGLTMPQGAGLPAFVMTHEKYFRAADLPLQLLKTLSTAAVAIAVWLYSQAVAHGVAPFAERSSLERPRSLRPVAIILCILAAGWVLTNVAGNHARERELREGSLYLGELVNFLNGELEAVAHQAADRIASPQLLTAMKRGDPAAIRSADAALERHDQLSNPRVPECRLRDLEGRVIAGCSHRPASEPALSVSSRARFAEAVESGRLNGYFGVDEETKERCYFVNAPIADGGRGILGVMTLRKPLAYVEESLRRHGNGFFVDPHGVVFLSGRKELLLKALWPIPDEVKGLLGASGQFGGGQFSPVLREEPYSGAYAFLDGRRYLVARQYMNPDGWSMVLLRRDGMIRMYRLFTIFTTAVLCGLTVLSFVSSYMGREAASRVAASERRYRSLVDGSPNCVVLLDAEGRCLAVNKAGLKIMGCGEADLVGCRMERVHPLPPAGSVDEIIAKVLRGNSRSFDAEVVRPDGGRVILQAALNPITDIYGTVTSIVGIFVDITDRKRTEEQLQGYQRRLEELVQERTVELTETNRRLQLEVAERQKTEEELSRHRDHLEELAGERTADLTIANEFLQVEITERRKAEEEVRAFSKRIETIINASNEMIVMKDRTLRYAVVNDAFLRFMGRQAEDIIGKTDFDVMPRDAAEACLQSDDAALMGGGPHETEEEVAGRWFHVFKQRVQDAEGNVTGIVAVIRDITDQKKAEAYQQKYKEHLEAEVQRRTAELMQANELLTREIDERKLVEADLEQALASVREEKEKTEAIIAALGDGIVIQDTNYRIIYQNRLQLEREGDRSGEFCYKAYHGIDTVCEGCPVELSFRDGLIHRTEIQIGSGADMRSIELTSSPLRDASGAIIAGIKIIRDMTERKRAEENLRLFSMAIEEAMDGVQIVDLNGRIVYSNHAVEDIYGYQAAELQGRSVNAMNADPAFADEHILPRIRETGRWSGELLVRHKDGRHFPIWLSASMVKDAAGVPLAMLGIVRDMTKRKELEAALREVGRRQEAILNNIPDLAWLKDIEGRFISVNEPFGRVCGEKPDDLRGRTDYDIWPAALADRYRADDLEVIRSGQRKCFEEPISDSGGNVRWLETIKTPIFDDQGAVVGTIGIARDITERRSVDEELKRHREHLMELVEERTVELKHAIDMLTAEINFRKGAEETLKQSETRYRSLSQEFHTLLDAIPDILLLLSPDLKVLWANRGATAEFGMAAEELTGRHCYSLWRGRTDPCPDCHVIGSFNTGEASMSRRTDERGRILDSRAFPIRDETGSVRNTILVVSDITEKTSLQAEAMRSSHLASLGELAAGVAHEINNPINGIINYAQILINRAGGGESDIFERIIKEGDRIANIVRSLLSFARERRDEMAPVDLRKILHETLVLTETQIRKDGIHLTVAVPDDMPPVVANAQQLQQVFLNLISNARYALNQKYSAADSRKALTISAETAPAEEGVVVRIVFEDQGTGIPAELTDRVMNPFFSTKPAGQGTGLGLSISHGIIRNHGGRIMIESRAGQFTRVVVEMPVREANGL